MQQLLHVVINGVLPKNVRQTIARLCLFFNVIYKKFTDPQKVDVLEHEASIILNQLEMYFPLLFFLILSYINEQSQIN